MKSSMSRSGKTEKPRPAAEPGISVKDAELTQAEIHAAEKLLEQALRPRVLPFYSPEERMALAILAANYSQLQRARGRKSKGAAKAQAEYRRNHVNLLLRYVVGETIPRKLPTPSRQS